jgi:peptidoglycan hydrolase CwlO-like protein
MGKNKKLRWQIGSLERRIREHEDKIAMEKERFNPDDGLITHWQKEINGWQRQIESKRNRLPRRV